MSRLAPSKASPASRANAKPGLTDAQDEICRVCKSTRYLNPRLRFLVNPVCYHKLCESCVDRLFGPGPAACPIPGCKETLRKNRFRVQTFEDIAVEREVDVRRKVGAVFNRREDEFEGIREYNDYLNEVEDITFNLIQGIDLEETEKRFEAYKRAHEQEIRENQSLEERERTEYRERAKEEKEAARLRRAAARREEVEERQEAAETRKDTLRRLEAGEDPAAVRRDEEAAAQKKMEEAKAADAKKGGLQAPKIRGLKSKRATEPEAEPPIDPFGGLRITSNFYTLQDDYMWDGVQLTKTDALVSAGGYDVDSFTQRALREAFAGLGVFVADEVTEREKKGQDEEVPGTVRAAVGAKDVKVEDPF